MILAFGEIREFNNTLTMTHPEYQLLQDKNEFQVNETLTPIYPSTLGLSQTRLRQLVNIALKSCQQELAQLEWMNPEQLQNYNFLPFGEAIQLLHNPPPDIPIQSLEQGSHPALKRLVFDELLAQHLSMQFARESRSSLHATALKPDKNRIQRFLASLPFELTKAQYRVADEISQDLMKTKPMLRLVQGDVGAGKTLIAALAALQAISNEQQVAFMAPTDLLTEQHTHNFIRWLEPLGIRLLRLSGKIKLSERRMAFASLADHSCDMVIGTHALFQDTVQFAHLGLVIIDEQHRFGVTQRLLLQQKANNIIYCPINY